MSERHESSIIVEAKSEVEGQSGPTFRPRVFECHRVGIAGDKLETDVVPVTFLNGLPRPGEQLIAHWIGDRWVICL